MTAHHTINVPERDIPPVLAHPDYACRTADTDLFFPERGQSANPARAICHHCPYQQECRDWAIRTRQQHGIWGGLTPEERQTLGRKQVAA
jgi:WhiB family transcriptional regulator, redox-sensing transcriptional regulator